jgi:hypothetical protein
MTPVVRGRVRWDTGYVGTATRSPGPQLPRMPACPQSPRLCSRPALCICEAATSPPIPAIANGVALVRSQDVSHYAWTRPFGIYLLSLERVLFHQALPAPPVRTYVYSAFSAPTRTHQIHHLTVFLFTCSPLSQDERALSLF